MNIPPYDAWVMARLVANLPVDGELEAVSAAFRPLDRAMAARALPERKRLFASTVGGRPDAAAWLCAVTAVDPKGPAPEPYTGTAADMAHIATVADRLGDCRLIVIDPVSAYLGGVDDHRNAEVRGILSPLKKMAERLNAAVVLLSHLSKGGSANAQQRVIGSIAYVGACRASFLFVKDREDPTGRRVLMLDNGGNLAPPASTLAYRIEDPGDGPRVEWLEDPLPITAEEALAADQAACQIGVTAPERREAEGWLSEVLSDGPVPALEVEAAADAAGVARRTLHRAKERLGIVSVKDGFGLKARWVWSLPEVHSA